MNKIYKILAWVFLAGFSSSFRCNDPDPMPQTHPAFIFYQNNSGQDLLDPNINGSFDLSGLSLSWLNLDQVIGTQLPTVNKNYGAIPSAPLGYFITVNPQSIIDDKGNNGVVYGNPKEVLIKLSASDSDTINFYYSGSSLQKVTYNKEVINPPSGMSVFPSSLPIVVTK